MKKQARSIIILFAVALLAALGIFIALLARARGGETKIEFPEGYTVITADNAAANSDFIELLGFGTESFSKYLKENNASLFAANENNSRQFLLRSYETDLSRELLDITGKGEEGLRLIGQSVFGNEGLRIVKASAGAFFEITSLEGEGDKKYCSVQFITIKNGKYYSLVYKGSTPEISQEEYDEARGILETLQIPEESDFALSADKENALFIGYALFIGVVMLLGLVSVILLSESLIKDFKKRKGAPKEEIRIKRRKKF